MSRNFVILLVVMSAAVAGLIVFSKMRSRPGQQAAVSVPTDTTPAPAVTQNPPPVQPLIDRTPVAGATNVQISVVKPRVPQIQTGVVPRTATIPVPTITNDTPGLPGLAQTKPLPVLEKEYVATTNRDTRLDVMMDIADAPGPDAVRALTRLFQVETDPDLKVDLLDSLLGIEGQVEEKLKMLTLGAEKGLPTDVRQSAIDGLIDLDDQRVIPVLNGLLNDPDEEVREGAKDALEMLQSKPAVKLK
jgi:hypothetical protein